MANRNPFNNDAIDKEGEDEKTIYLELDRRLESSREESVTVTGTAGGGGGDRARKLSISTIYLELDRRCESGRDEAVTGAGVGGDGARKLSISTTACSAALLAVVCFAISLAIVLLVNCVNKSICPVRRSLRKTVIASAIFLLIASTAAVYLGYKVFRSVKICLRM